MAGFSRLFGGEMVEDSYAAYCEIACKRDSNTGRLYPMHIQSGEQLATALRAMIEKSAWEKLAQAWENSRDSRTDSLFGHDGLCFGIDDLKYRGDIDEVVHRSMMAKIDVLAHNDGYCWPLNAIGAKQRAEFCRRAANENS